ncbi:unnamed protein product [Colias eurytheme]|nr:unnamed protein product [Colias eurytheme]
MPLDNNFNHVGRQRTTITGRDVAINTRREINAGRVINLRVGDRVLIPRSEEVTDTIAATFTRALLYTPHSTPHVENNKKEIELILKRFHPSQLARQLRMRHWAGRGGGWLASRVEASSDGWFPTAILMLRRRQRPPDAFLNNSLLKNSH